MSSLVRLKCTHFSKTYEKPTQKTHNFGQKKEMKKRRWKYFSINNILIQTYILCRYQMYNCFFNWICRKVVMENFYLSVLFFMLLHVCSLQSIRLFLWDSDVEFYVCLSRTTKIIDFEIVISFERKQIFYWRLFLS